MLSWVKLTSGNGSKGDILKLEYIPYEKRTVDDQYRKLLKSILKNGEDVNTRQGPTARTLIGTQMRYNLSNGFPVITIRKLGFWKKAIGELCAFINGARTTDEFEEFGCDWWDAWATEEKCSKRNLATGDLGPASYGGMFHDHPDAEGKTYDQFEHLVRQIEEFPNDRTHLVDPWYGPWLARDSGRINKATIAPCHGWVQVTIINGRMDLHMTQRSGDVPVGVPANMVQYSALLIMLASLTGHEVGEYIHYIVNAHIYKNQYKAAREMVKRESGRLPTVNLTEKGKKVTKIHDFRAEHFEITDYFPLSAIRDIPVAT